jgi:hypothetical protein
MKTYSKGQKFLRTYPTTPPELYVLAITGVELGTEKAHMNLICVKTGDRWSKPVGVDDCMKVTMGEFDKLSTSGTFVAVRVEDVKVSQVTHTTTHVRLER